MIRLHLYNPQNDVALATGSSSFTPPKSARKLACAGALLPLWWAGRDDYVLASADLCSKAERLMARYGLGGSLVERLGDDKRVKPEPWGWSLNARHMFRRAGVDDTLLPADARLERIRALSHRRTSIAVLREFGFSEEMVPVEVFSKDGFVDAVMRWGRVVVKLPWSCSGRGVFFVSSGKGASYTDWIEGAIGRYGSVVVEPFYDAVGECAALFYADGTGGVSLRGFSVFESSANGAYKGNVVDCQDEIMARCGEDAVSASQRLQGVLGKVIGMDYEGWMGVDMLRHGGGLLPCMELNLRRTMGVVAMHIAGYGLRGMLGYDVRRGAMMLDDVEL